MRFLVIKTTVLTTEYREEIEADSFEEADAMAQNDEIDFTKGYDGMEHYYEVEALDS